MVWGMVFWINCAIATQIISLALGCRTPSDVFQRKDYSIELQFHVIHGIIAKPNTDCQKQTDTIHLEPGVTLKMAAVTGCPGGCRLCTQ